ncbi:hypothetical protein KK062_22395 [Fulvivirgaceae bacterium PWU5]|uniref:DUF5648 domain-containing protein n=1 Tax=Dawidia cretensis TaxID=2782350 RepID=A0AAP2E1G4_9BACT|nr:M57 family metalloprotease [Dawidia cretensis]MBT1711010.1 hypothetical protein [Dawidia cretensis]
MYHQKLVTKNILSLFIIVLLFLSSCEKESDVDPAGASANDIAVLKSFLSEFSGESVSDVTFKNKKFTIGGDIVLSLDDARNYYAKSLTEENPGGRTQQRKWTTYLGASTISNIKLTINEGVPAEWRNATYAAIANWNASDSKVHIEEGLGGADDAGKVTVFMQALEPNAIASAEFPGTQGPPFYPQAIRINPAYNSIGYSQKVATLTHELGHIFGFMHTDVNEGALITDTPVSDPASIMNHVVGNWNGFSFYDQVAIASAYPRKLNTRKFLRYYSSANTDHFYTIHPNEMGPTGNGWVFEGGAGYIFGAQASGTVPLYRYYDAVTKDHFYTMNFGEVSWTYEGIAGYVSATATSETRPLYRYFNTATQDHFYTVNQGEVSGPQWNNEGIACYVY